MFSLLKAKEKELQPYFEKDRPSCPFYGFYISVGRKFSIMMDQRGNRCALVKKRYSPCHMEMDKLKPCWNNCSSNKEKLEELFKEISVFPDEFLPPRIKSWEGILLKDWIKYIENKK